MDRRRFLKSSALAGAALAGMEPGAMERGVGVPALVGAAAAPPNILVVVVDQLRSPTPGADPPNLAALLPNITRLRSGAVNFGRHFCAATCSTPSRSAMLTGLYPHQTGCMLTLVPTKPDLPGLQPGFPTWGTLLRGLGYQTFWYGKWHLSTTCDLEPYGFAGGTCPSPNGYPGEGLLKDSAIADQFVAWLSAQGSAGPWATTVSFVNPHDAGWYYTDTDPFPAYRSPPQLVTALPPNFETPGDLQARNKPRLLRAQIWRSDHYLGALPFDQPGFEAGWIKLLNVYFHCQRLVDYQIGRVLDALAAHPAAGQTIVIFTADHGEYGGAHGERGKGFGLFEESIRVPFSVKDPTGLYSAQPEIVRTQLTSHVDLTPLLLTLASGGSGWRSKPALAHLSRRLDLAAILRDPAALGRPFVLHTSDDNSVDDVAGLPPDLTNTPQHVIGYRTAAAKLGLYSYWAPNSIDILTDGQENELYDYRTQPGRLELDNVVATKPGLYSNLYAALTESAIPRELRAPLPAYLLPAQQAGIQAYLAAIAPPPPPRR